MSTSTTISTNEYFGKNALGQIRCKLCDTLHRDEANFLIHTDSKKHTTNLKIIEIKKAQQREEHDAKVAIAKQEAHDARQDQLAQLSNGAIVPSNSAKTLIIPSSNKNNTQTVGLPEVKVQIDELGSNQANSRITFTLSFPLANTTGSATAPPSRPMHRWLNTYEQSVEQRDPSKQYLVFACEPYDSVSYAFPSNLNVATAENTDAKDIQRYFCRWYPVEKTYRLMFTVSHR
jgi:splicing factor 3A subunit 2